MDKFKNAKQSARTVDVLLKQQSNTGGGSLTPKEKRIVNSVGYLELANKLGRSARGNMPRADSDADLTASLTSPPTNRLRTRLTTRLFTTSQDQPNESVANGSVIFEQTKVKFTCLFMFVIAFSDSVDRTENSNASLANRVITQVNLNGSC